MTLSQSRPTFLILVLLVLAALTASCVMPVPVEETPVPTAPERPGDGELRDIQRDCRKLSLAGKAKQAETPTPSPQAAEMAGLPIEDLPTMQRPPFLDLIYVEGQVLLIGQPEVVQEISQTFQSKLGIGLGIDERLRPIALDDGRTIQLAAISSGESVEEITCLFNTYGAERGVAADPNYFMSPAGWRGGGSPWTQNGYWASNLPGGGLGYAEPDQLLGQWALGPAGINVQNEDGSRTTDWKGEGVTIAVLDTAPWKLPCLGGAPCSKEFPLGPLSASVTLWELRPADPATCPGMDAWNGELDRDAQNINNHGLFAASLAHVVAPQSTIHLLRVLEDDGCGDLFKVLQGLQLFEDYMSAASQGDVIGGNKPLTNSVVNLSLGVHQPDDAAAFALPPEVTALRDKLQHMIGLGAVIVAAAGNDSFAADPSARAPGDPDAPLEAEMPARDDQIIGVAATTKDRARSCFSNIGDVGAPGGDGLKLAQVPQDPALKAAAAAGEYSNCIVPGQVYPKSDDYWCQVPGNETTCLVGVALDPNTRAASYRYWVGTSFATPLVSGIAALKLQQGVPPDQVDDEIFLGAETPGVGAPFLGAGIADAAN